MKSMIENNKDGTGDRQENKAEDLKLMTVIREICRKGSDAEVRQNKDGTLKVYEVKRHIAG